MPYTRAKYVTRFRVERICPSRCGGSRSPGLVAELGSCAVVPWNFASNSRGRFSIRHKSRWWISLRRSRLRSSRRRSACLTRTEMVLLCPSCSAPFVFQFPVFVLHAPCLWLSGCGNPVALFGVPPKLRGKPAFLAIFILSHVRIRFLLACILDMNTCVSNADCLYRTVGRIRALSGQARGRI